MTGLPTVRVFEDDPSLLGRLVSSNTPGVTNVTDDGLAHRLALEGQKSQTLNPLVLSVLAAEVPPVMRDMSKSKPTVLGALFRTPELLVPEISGATGLTQEEVDERLGVLAALNLVSVDMRNPDEPLYSAASVQ